MFNHGRLFLLSLDVIIIIILNWIFRFLRTVASSANFQLTAPANANPANPANLRKCALLTAQFDGALLDLSSGAHCCFTDARPAHFAPISKTDFFGLDWTR